MLGEDLVQKEDDFNGWLDSIEFVNDDGNVVLVVLEKDESDDPEGDRE